MSRCRRRSRACKWPWASFDAKVLWATRRRWWRTSPSGSGWCTKTSSMRSSSNMPTSTERQDRHAMETAKTAHTPVLIVGAGPVGLALAGELGWRGVPCTLIEKTDGAIEQPKMDMVGPRTMEFCRRWGIADWVRDAPYPGDYPQDCVYLTALNGYELGRERFPPRAQERCPPQSPQKRERVPQDMFDPILQRFVRSFEHVRLAYRTELVSFEKLRRHSIGGLLERDELANGVTAQLLDVATGETRELAADYL